MPAAIQNILRLILYLFWLTNYAWLQSQKITILTFKIQKNTASKPAPILWFQELLIKHACYLRQNAHSSYQQTLCNVHLRVMQVNLKQLFKWLDTSNARSAQTYSLKVTAHASPLVQIITLLFILRMYVFKKENSLCKLAPVTKCKLMENPAIQNASTQTFS